ncbi:TPA: ead/Ea22-like family protein [Escherichia albertii]|nr:ead/Ea22-like family protein [Escherichia albertii]
MSEINYQELREAAAQAMHDDWGFDADLFHELVTPSIVLALLDERERNQQYIKRRDQENEDIALTVGKLRVELEETKLKLNEQREYYEGVISDGSKRIAELEAREVTLPAEKFCQADYPGILLWAEPVAYIFKHPAGKLFWALTDESNKEQSDVIPVYAAPPVPVVPEEKPMPNPLSMYAVDAVAAIAEVRGWNACRAAMLKGDKS